MIEYGKDPRLFLLLLGLFAALLGVALSGPCHSEEPCCTHNAGTMPAYGD